MFIDVHIDGSFDHSWMTSDEARDEMVAKCNETRRFRTTAPLPPYLCFRGNPTARLLSTVGTEGNSRFSRKVRERLTNNGSNDGDIVIGNTRFVLTRAGIF